MAHEYELKFTQEPTQELKFCQQAPSSSTSGITGVGSVDYVTKIKTLVGADGSAIVTIGNSRFYESDTESYVKNSFGAKTFDFEAALVNTKGGSSSLDAENRTLKKADGDIVLDYQNQWLFKSVVGGVYNPTAIYDNLFHSKIFDFPTMQLYDGGGTEISINLEYRQLQKAGNVCVFDWQTETFTNSLIQSVTLGEIAILGAAQQGTVGQVLTTSGAGTLSWTTVSGGSGITSLNTLTGATQTFVDDTNITIVSAGTTHTLTWAGTLAAGRLNSNVVQAITNDTNITGSITAQNLTLGWTGTLADARIASAATWNAKESALTFSTGLTRATNTITNDLLTGHAGGQKIISGTAATDKLVIQTTSGNQVTGASNLITFKSGNNGANELLRIGDGIAIGELSMWAAGQSSNTTHWVRAGTNFTYFNAGTDLRLMVGASNYINMLSGSGTVAIQKPLTFASGANVTLVANSTSLASLVFTGGGTYKTTPIAGGVEYNGQFSMTPTDATRRFVTLAASSTKTTAGAPYTNDGYVTLNINGTDVKVMTTA